MKVFGDIEFKVKTFKRKKDAKKAEAKWLKRNDIKDEEDREVREEQGLHFTIYRCKVKE